jgi:membrane dipeptidase
MDARVTDLPSGALEAAGELLRRTLVWDNHACMPLRPGDEGFLPQLERLRASGVNVVSLNVGFGPQDLDAHVRMLATFRRWVAAHPDQYRLGSSVAEIDAAQAAGQMAVVFDVEGMVPLDPGEDGLVQLFYDLGVRWMLVAYNRRNAAGSGVYDPEDEGLTAHGRKILAEMKRAGMVVCCSHTAHRTAREVIEAADNPVVFSHSNAAAVHPHARNIPDELILACAATGGVVGVNGVGPFLGAKGDLAEAMVRHIDHIAELVGPDHVGLAFDYTFDRDELAEHLANMRDTFPDDDTYATVPPFAPPEALTEVTARLAALGYGEADLRKILGGAWRRVAQAVWR